MSSASSASHSEMYPHWSLASGTSGQPFSPFNTFESARAINNRVASIWMCSLATRSRIAGSRNASGFSAFAVCEEHLAEQRVAGDLADRPDVDAGQFHVDDERGDALVLAAARDRGRVGAQQEQAPLRDLR